MFEIINYAIASHRGLVISIQSPDLPAFEIIKNPPENVSLKAAYYDQAYDENLRLRSNPAIKIVQAGTF